MSHLSRLPHYIQEEERKALKNYFKRTCHLCDNEIDVGVDVGRYMSHYVHLGCKIDEITPTSVTVIDGEVTPEIIPAQRGREPDLMKQFISPRRSSRGAGLALPERQRNYRAGLPENVTKL